MAAHVDSVFLIPVGGRLAGKRKPPRDTDVQYETVESAQALLVTGSEPTVGRGVFLPALDGATCVQSHGWGIGFQCLLRAYPEHGEAVVVMIDADPGVPQGESLVGQVVEAWAAARGLPA